MHNQVSLNTDRLLIEPLTICEHVFIFELLNTEGWRKFIGNNKINSAVEATKYIERVIENPDTIYWVVKLKGSQTAIGIITFIKRDYLEHHDIGFALLPGYTGKGFAYEATQTVLQHIRSNYNLLYMQAVTVPGNSSSIKLLVKLGFYFTGEIEVQNEILHLYTTKLNRLHEIVSK